VVALRRRAAVARFARQRWRAWIETARWPPAWPGPVGSPVSDGGRGLKHPSGQRSTGQRHGSPVSDGGRGLKPLCYPRLRMQNWFARQRWRACIETSANRRHHPAAVGFARQRWRAWIETGRAWHQPQKTSGSPVSDGGRGLKRGGVAQTGGSGDGSPVSDGGRGLKPNAPP